MGYVYNRYYLRNIKETNKLNNSVLTLQEWGNMLIEANRGEKDVK